MGTYLMFGNYTIDAVEDISAERTVKAEAMMRKFGGEFQSGYALLGDNDLVLIVEFPDNESAMKASVALTQLLEIAFTTAPAVSVEDFDKLMEEV
ncbi:MAG: GYD domain-containing protein [Anaerolineales bacterium]